MIHKYFFTILIYSVFLISLYICIIILILNFNLVGSVFRFDIVDFYIVTSFFIIFHHFWSIQRVFRQFLHPFWHQRTNHKTFFCRIVYHSKPTVLLAFPSWFNISGLICLSGEWRFKKNLRYKFTMRFFLIFLVISVKSFHNWFFYPDSY